MNTAKISDQRVFAVVIVVHGYMQSFCNTADPAPPLTNDQQVVRLRTYFDPRGHPGGGMTHEYSQNLRPKGVCGGYSRAWVYAKFLQHRGPRPPPLKRPTGRAAEDRISTRWGHAHGAGDPTVLTITLKRFVLRLWAAMRSLVKADRPTTLRKAVIGTPCGCARGCLRLRISMPREAHAGLESCSEHISR